MWSESQPDGKGTRNQHNTAGFDIGKRAQAYECECPLEIGKKKQKKNKETDSPPELPKRMNILIVASETMLDLGTTKL